ncbi:hypothetical protein QUW02_11890 [Bacteroides eggerthii]|uniref:DUF4837 family protein n=1 Tax=Bacteroides eggerthii TaxID=28111 RepID=A0ABT7U7V7_9BACE|nr:hypothetical protein [Bacteroides eggerthii]
MNRIFEIGFIIFILFLSSCEQKKEITYEKYICLDKSYSIEVPSNVVQGKCIADFMSFEDSQYNLLIRVERINESSIDEYISNKDIKDNSFTYNLFQSSDTTSYFKITRGNNMWSAYDLYMLKKIMGTNYLINVNSDYLNKSEMIEIINHIYTSMSQEVKQKEVCVSSKDTQETISSIYSNKYYSIKYPKEWNITEKLNEMTDVYIGSQTENFGFTIVRFETEYTLSEINADGNESIRQAVFRIKEEKPIILKGLKCYRAIHEVSVQNQNVKHISYTFKKDNMLYNIKFGNVTTKAQETLASEIIETFNFK